MDLKDCTKLTVIGLMSGTSLDGCDAVLSTIESKNNKLEISVKSFITHPMPNELRQQIVKQLKPESSRIDLLTKLDAALSTWFISAVDALLEHSGTRREDIDVIGSHGQTMWHDVNTKDNRNTWQLGDGSFIAAVTGITTVSDFRTADVAVGGQGAPLIPFFDNLQYGGSEQNVALQNIGGIGNVTLVPAKSLLASGSKVMGFDTGPGNMIIDRFMDRISEGKQLYDKDGALAASGTVNDTLLRKWLQHPFFLQPPPKSTGREQFGHEYADERYREAMEQGLSAADAIATATAFTARTIALAYRIAFSGSNSALTPHKVVVAGGGAHNKTLMSMLSSLLVPAAVVRAGEEGTPGEVSADCKEAVAFAVFAYLALFGKSNHLPSTTGADREVILGKICPGKNYQRLCLKKPVRTLGDSTPTASTATSTSTTETRNPSTTNIDELSAEQVIALMNQEDAHVVSVVESVRPQVAAVAEKVAACLRGGGHIFYVGAGSSGRLGVLDASEIPPTFSAPPEWFQGVIAGGDYALSRAVEGAEDNRQQGGQDLKERGVRGGDVVVGIAASGSTPYVHGALEAAHSVDAHTVLLSCNHIPQVPSYVSTLLEAVVGPEVITGSTRLKAGTATKLILNQISTTAMVLLGKTHGNLMVDIRASNVKLNKRALGIIQTFTDATLEEAEELLQAAGGSVKLAIAMRATGLAKEVAEEALVKSEGRLSGVLSAVQKKG